MASIATSRQPTRPWVATPRKPKGAARLGHAVLGGIGAWIEHVGEDVLPRITGPVLAAWYVIGGALGMAMSEISFLACWLCIMIVVFVREWAPEWNGRALSWPLPTVPRGARWWTAAVLVLGTWPLWLSSGGGLGLQVSLIYLVSATVAFTVWRLNGPPQWAAREAEEREAWQKTAARVGLGPDARLLDIDQIPTGDRYQILIGHEAGKTVEYYLTTGKLAAKFAQFWRVPIGRVDARPDPRREGVVWVTRLRAGAWSRVWPHPVYADPAAVAVRRRSIMDPIPVGVDPLTGNPISVLLADEDGGRGMVVVGKKGSGKTTFGDVLLEAVTACTDTEVDIIDLAKGRNARLWGPLCRRIAVQTHDPGQADQDALEILREARQLIIDRAKVGGDAVFQVDTEHRARVIVIDEASALIGMARPDSDPVAREARELLGFLCTKDRSEMVITIVIGQRPSREHMGKTDVVANAANRVLLALGSSADQATLRGSDEGGSLPDMTRANQLGKGVFLVLADGQESQYGRGLDLHVLAHLQALITARVKGRAADPSWSTSEEQSEDAVTVTHVDGKPYSTGSPLRMLEAGAEWLAGQFRGAELDEDDVPWPLVESTAEGMFWAAVLRARAPQLRGMVGQHEVTVDGHTFDHPYRLDFYIDRARLALEIDGKLHEPGRDAQRDALLAAHHGIETERFPAVEVMRDADGCVRRAIDVAAKRLGDAPLIPLPQLPPLSKPAAAAWSELRTRRGVVGVSEAWQLTGVGRTTGKIAVRELLHRGLLVEVIDPETGKPYYGRAKRYIVPRLHAYAT